MGVTECDNMLMHVGVSQKMSDKERDAVLPLLATGFKVSDFCRRQYTAYVFVNYICVCACVCVCVQLLSNS